MRWTRIGGMAALVGLAIGLALSLGLWGHWTASAQDTFIVNDDTTPADGGCGTPDFETEDIQDAIDSGLVADGDTLIICPGTYTRAAVATVEVDKQLVIEGLASADREDVLVQGHGLGGFTVWVDGVTIRHLKLVAGPADLDGIALAAGADNNMIQDVEVTAWAQGIFWDHSDGNIIETSYIHTNAGQGLYLNSGAHNIVRNNEIVDNNTYGIEFAGGDELLIENNILSGNVEGQIEVVGKNHARIYRNQIENTGAADSNGVSLWAMPAEALIQIGGSAENANTFTGPFGDGSYYVELHCNGEDTVNATYNWWGSTNRSDIANRIFNDEDDAGTECTAPDDVKGAVVFHPWATGPASTPTPSPTPTATGTPTATATGTPTPTATPGATRTIDLSPAGWHDLAWSGAAATDPGAALACIAGDYSIAYAWEGPTAGFKRHVEGCAIPGICNMADLNKYDTLLVNISAAGTSCVMPVAP
jgi:parallel beta-helix repeat protein